MHTGFSFCEWGSPFCLSLSALHRAPGLCSAASGCHWLPKVPAAGAPVPAPHLRAGGGPYLPDQAASSVFARGGAKGETEALQNAVATVTRHWRGTMGDIAFRAPATLRTAAGQQRQKRPEFELQSRAT